MSPSEFKKWLGDMMSFETKLHPDNPQKLVRLNEIQRMWNAGVTYPGAIALGKRNQRMQAESDSLRSAHGVPQRPLRPENPRVDPDNTKSVEIRPDNFVSRLIGVLVNGDFSGLGGYDRRVNERAAANRALPENREAAAYDAEWNRAWQERSQTKGQDY